MRAESRPERRSRATGMTTAADQQRRLRTGRMPAGPQRRGQLPVPSDDRHDDDARRTATAAMKSDARAIATERARPTAIAAGRLRPARDFLRFGLPPSSGEGAPVDPLMRTVLSDLEQLGFLVLEQSSIMATCLAVRSSSAFSARRTSSSPASPSLLELVERVLGVPADVAHRDARVLGLVLGDLDVLLAALLGELGRTTRITLPSLAGLTPRSESRMAFSMACIALLSYGEIRIIRASGV